MFVFRDDVELCVIIFRGDVFRTFGPCYGKRTLGQKDMCMPHRLETHILPQRTFQVTPPLRLVAWSETLVLSDLGT
jgi:hypothetical protein